MLLTIIVNVNIKKCLYTLSISALAMKSKKKNKYALFQHQQLLLYNPGKNNFDSNLTSMCELTFDSS